MSMPRSASSRRRNPWMIATASPSLCAVATAPAQSGATPSSSGLMAKRCPPETKVIGTPATVAPVDADPSGEAPRGARKGGAADHRDRDEDRRDSQDAEMIDVNAQNS